MTQQASAKRVSDRDGKIGQRVRAFRIAAGESQTQLANHLGLTFQQVQKYEKGTNRVSGSRLQEIAAHYGRRIADFYPEDMLSEGADAHGADLIGFMIDKPAIALNTAFATVTDMDRRRRIADAVALMCEAE